MKHYQAVVIGGGCAGLAASIALKKKGIQDVVILEKDDEAGGILNQCIHNGFGLTTFKEQLSGPAFAERFENQAAELGVMIKTGAMVVKLNPDKTIEYESMEEGYVKISADAIILTVGCYERNRGAIQTPGTRPAGVFTAGQAQRYLNIDGYMVGNRVFILGSGDIGLIMARRMTLEGAKVLGVAEMMPYSNGLPRNMKQCLEDFHIPLYLSHTVSKIYGRDRLSGIDIAEVGPDRRTIPGTEQHFDCDTLLLSVGLIPENHLADACGIRMDPHIKGPFVDETYMTSVEGIFAAGNGLHVHDLADYAAHQGGKAGEGAASYILHGVNDSDEIHTEAGNNIGYVVPGVLHTGNLPPVVEFFFRVRTPQDHASIVIRNGDQIIRTIHKDKLLPSVMENVILAGKQLEGLKENLIVEVREDT